MLTSNLPASMSTPTLSLGVEITMVSICESETRAFLAAWRTEASMSDIEASVLHAAKKTLVSDSQIETMVISTPSDSVGVDIDAGKLDVSIELADPHQVAATITTKLKNTRRFQEDDLLGYIFRPMGVVEIELLHAEACKIFLRPRPLI